MSSSNVAKGYIKSLDEGSLKLDLMFNPKELSLDKKVPWNPQYTSGKDLPAMEFTNGQAMSLSVELMFDTYESKKNVHKEHITKLVKMALIDSTRKRPHLCLFGWGNLHFRGVIDSLTQKYTMFLADGTPVRATVSLKMTQADKAQFKEKDAKKASSAGASSSGGTGDPFEDSGS